MGEIRVDPDGVAGAGAALAAAARRLSDAHAGLARTWDARIAMAGEPAGSAYGRMHEAWLAQLATLARRLELLAAATGTAANAYLEADAALPAGEG
jgi:uncharacterized protein YukE